ncbi:tetratricopeptide repeat protein [Ekhidna sp.]|uniref:CHAT domain-containing protein n=1 Tax=Ekhidna sp. TaxID=2608089 RepID=UPI0032F09BE3
MKNVLACIIFSMVLGLSYAQNINSLISEAEQNLERNHWEKARDSFKQIIDSYEDDMTYHQRAKVYNHLGYLHYSLLDPFEAERYLNLSILYHEEAGIPNQRDYAEALLNMGVLYLDQVEFDLARQYIQKSLDILEKLPNARAQYWIARSKLGFVYEEAGSYTLALSIYNESYEQLVALGNDLSPDFAEICMHKGRILIFTGDPDEGEKFINLSTTIYESLGPDFAVQRAESLEHLAIFFERMGRYDEAEETLLTVLRLKRTIPDEADILIIETLNDLGIMYHQLGQYEKAKEMFNEVVSECEENVGTDHPFYATAKNNLGALAISEGNFVDAREMFNAALTTYKVKFGESHPYYANTLNNLARVERKLGNTYLAEQYYREVLKIDERIYGKDHPDYATTLINLGILCSANGREDEAAKYYEEAVQIRAKVLGENHPAYGSALEYMGMHALAIGNYSNAEKYFSESIRIQIDRIHTLFPIMSEIDRQSFYDGIIKSIDRYNFIAFGLLDQKPELIKNIYDFHVKTKGILFSTSDKVLEKIQESDDYELKELYRQWQSDKRLLASYFQMGIHELEDLNINLQYEETRIERLEDNLISRIDNFEGSLQRFRENWQSVQQKVRSNEAFVELIQIREFESLDQAQGTLFSFTNYTKYLAVIFLPNQDEPVFEIIGTDGTTDPQYLSQYRDYIDGDTDGQSSFEVLWEPIHDRVKNVDFVRLGSDGIFHGINPNVFKTSGKNHVIDDYLVTNLSSPHDLFRENAVVYSQRAYIFSNPDYVSSEISDPADLGELPVISGLSEEVFDPVDWSVRSYEGENANELRIRSAFNPTVLHIDAYGFFEDRFKYIRTKSPLTSKLFQSGIYLSGASESYSRFLEGIRTISENDGILSTHEIMNLDLTKTKLVVVSDIVNQTNSSTANASYGLQRAFMVAGAHNVLMRVLKSEQDITKELLTLFYKKYNETKKIGSSLKQAQLELRAKYPDPKIWGGFMITGIE